MSTPLLVGFCCGAVALTSRKRKLVKRKGRKVYGASKRRRRR